MCLSRLVSSTRVTLKKGNMGTCLAQALPTGAAKTLGAGCTPSFLPSIHPAGFHHGACHICTVSSPSNNSLGWVTPERSTLLSVCLLSSVTFLSGWIITDHGNLRSKKSLRNTVQMDRHLSGAQGWHVCVWKGLNRRQKSYLFIKWLGSHLEAQWSVRLRASTSLCCTLYNSAVVVFCFILLI